MRPCHLVQLAPPEKYESNQVLRYADQIANTLNTDLLLRECLGYTECTPPVVDLELIKHVVEWCSLNRAMSFAIVTGGDIAVGILSISRICVDNGTARCGFFLSSAYWGMGYGTLAFEDALRIASEEGVHRISGRINADNARSLRIWERKGASFSEVDGGACFEATVTLPSLVPGIHGCGAVS